MALRDREFEDTEFMKDSRDFDSGMSRETLMQSELSGSVSIFPASFQRENSQTKERSRKTCIITVIVVLVFLLGVILLIVGLAMLSTIPKCERLSDKARHQMMCQPSSEALENGFYKLLDKVQARYYEGFPNKIAHKRPVSVTEIRQKFRVYDPSPVWKKNVTDRTMELLREVNQLKMNKLKLTQREAKALSQLKQTLKYMYGNTYSTNYYAGDYLLGPNLWCYWDPICSVGYDLSKTLHYFKPNNVTDMELLRDKLKEVQSAFNQYVENLRYGVKAGFVRTEKECEASINGLKSRYMNIANQGAQGVFKEDFLKEILSPSFLSNFTQNSQKTKDWVSKYTKTPQGSLRGFVLEYVGKPIANLFRYYQTEHLVNCVPSNISSGLSSLPLPFVYVNGTADTSQPTTKRLPTGEELIGKNTYKKLIGAFTTNDMTPDEIYDLGMEMFRKLYPEALELAKKVTGQSNNEDAIQLFLQKLNSSEMFYNKEPFPVNESDKNAYKMCSTVENAKKYCPKRWQAIQGMFEDIRGYNSLLYPKIVKMFHFAGDKYSVPNCPIEIAPELNPSVGANYRPAGSECTRSAKYKVSFFKEKFGPKWSLLTISAHEGRPGHHTQAQGMLERFRDTCGGVIGWLDSLTYYAAFIEGWGLYAESPLVGKDTDVYNERPYDKYGLIKWQIWRALRLVVDVGLHYKGMSREKALEYFAKYTWEDGEMAQKEVTRYQSGFGQATSYMTGHQQIVKARAYAQRELGAKFNLKDFHFYLLSQGAYPLNYVTEIVEMYVSCMKNKEQPGCDNVLNPPRAPEGAGIDPGVQGDTEYRYDPWEPIPDARYF